MDLLIQKGLCVALKNRTEWARRAHFSSLRWDEKVDPLITDRVKRPVIHAFDGAITIDIIRRSTLEGEYREEGPESRYRNSALFLRQKGSICAISIPAN